MSSRTKTAKSLAVACPRCLAPAGSRCWNLWRFHPGGVLRPEYQRRQPGHRSGRERNRKSHAERIRANAREGSE